MKYSKVGIIVLCLVISILSVNVSCLAASKSKKAYKAYAKAVSTGQIKWGDGAKWYMDDMNGDKVPELIMTKDGYYLRIFTVRSGKVKKIVNKLPDMVFCYWKNKTLWESGEGDGGWCIQYKLKGTKLKKIAGYYGGLYPKPYHYVERNGKKKNITEKEYIAKFAAVTKKAVKWNETSKSAFIARMKKA